MSIDNLGDVRHAVDRMGLPPRLRTLIDRLEEKSGPIDELPATGEAEVRTVLGWVAGPGLLAAIVAHMLGAIPDDELPQPEPTPEPEPDEDADPEGGDPDPDGDDPVDDQSGAEGDPPPPPDTETGETDRTTT